MNDRVARMIAEADDRLSDAAVLGESLRDQGNSQSLLRILALEILLKAAQLQATGHITRSHRYIELWAAIPEGARQQVLTAASLRYPGHVNLGNTEKLLCVYEWLFTKARYGYELYEHMSLEEQAELGDEWIARGAPVDEADIQYFPMELSALIHGLLLTLRSAA